MANLAKMKADGVPFRGAIIGYPGSAKTGSLAALANAGFKLRVIDFEGNFEPLINYIKPEFHKNVDIVTVQDPMVLEKGAKNIMPAGTPMAFNKAMELGKHWKYKDTDGEEVDLGKPIDWGPDTVLAVDSLTAMGEAAFFRALNYANATLSYVPPAVYGATVNDLSQGIKLLSRANRRHHFIILGHLRMLGPDDYIKMDEKDTKGHADLKPIRDAKLEAIAADLLPVRLYPVGATKNQSPLILKDLPIVLLAENIVSQGKSKRVLWTRTTKPLDLKFPVENAPERVDIEDGLAKLFKLMGHDSPKA